MSKKKNDTHAVPGCTIVYVKKGKEKGACTSPIIASKFPDKHLTILEPRNPRIGV